MKKYFITGIDTHVGKTFCSAVLTEALQTDYWKPVQTGETEGTDVQEIINLISNQKTKIHQETYKFTAAVSPHLAAAIENQTIDIDKINLPYTNNHLIIEGAGGILVPLNKTNYMIDLAKKLDAEVILVIRNYVGCINHSLLSINYLKENNFIIKGLILNGDFDALVEESIRVYSDIPLLAKFPHVNRIDKKSVSELARSIQKTDFI